MSSYYSIDCWLTLNISGASILLKILIWSINANNNMNINTKGEMIKKYFCQESFLVVYMIRLRGYNDVFESQDCFLSAIEYTPENLCFLSTVEYTQRTWERS